MESRIFEVTINHLPGKFTWKHVSANLMDYGWCVCPVDDEARETLNSMPSVGYRAVNVFKKDGSSKEIILAGEEIKGCLSNEYGFRTVTQFKKEMKDSFKALKLMGKYDRLVIIEK